MSYEVRIVTDGAELRTLAKMAAAHHSEEIACAPVLRCVALSDLLSAPRVYGAYLDGQPVAVATCSERGQGGWLTGLREHMAPAGAAMVRAIAEEFGTFFGDMGNPVTRAELVTASGGHLADDGGTIRWVD